MSGEAIEFEVGGRKFLLYPLVKMRGSFLRVARWQKMFSGSDNPDDWVAVITEILHTSTNLTPDEADAVLADLTIEEAGRILQAFTGQGGQSPFGPTETT
jgi:hypothetical protein